MKEMKIKQIDIEEIKPYGNNPRVIGDNAIDEVAKSISEFGFRNPIIVDKNNVIIAGHTRYLASKKLGMEKIPCLVADDLTEKQIKAFRIADNKVAEKSKWDYFSLAIEVKDILGDDNMDEVNELIGFGQREVENILSLVKTETIDLDTDFGEQEKTVQPDVNVYNPQLEPKQAQRVVTDEDIERQQEKLDNQFKSTLLDYEDIICPNCAHTFKMRKK